MERRWRRAREEEEPGKREKEGQTETRENRVERETEREGDLGSAYRSGRVTCVPEVGVLGTDQSEGYSSLSPSFSVSLALLLYTSLLIPLAHLHCRSSSHSLLPTASRFYLDTQQVRTHAGMHARTRARARVHAPYTHASFSLTFYIF